MGILWPAFRPEFFKKMVFSSEIFTRKSLLLATNREFRKSAVDFVAGTSIISAMSERRGQRV